MCTPCGLRRTPRSAKSNTRSLPWKPSRFPRPLRGGREPAAMGYRGKVELQEQARVLRARGKTLAQIADALGVAKSSVSLWVRDVPFTPSPRRHGPHRRPNPAHEAKLRQIEELNREGRERIRTLSSGEFLVVGVALYAGEGAKGDEIGRASCRERVE